MKRPFKKKAEELNEGEYRYCDCRNVISKELGGVYKNGEWCCLRCHGLEIKTENKPIQPRRAILDIWDYGTLRLPYKNANPSFI